MFRALFGFLSSSGRFAFRAQNRLLRPRLPVAGVAGVGQRPLVTFSRAQSSTGRRCAFLELFMFSASVDQDTSNRFITKLRLIYLPQ